jgi:hypothetical protein
MSETSDALRQLADRLDLDASFAPVACAIALTDVNGKMKATYIGREQPAEAALTHLLARGIEQTVVSRLAMTAVCGSTH